MSTVEKASENKGVESVQESEAQHAALENAESDEDVGSPAATAGLGLGPGEREVESDEAVEAAKMLKNYKYRIAEMDKNAEEKMAQVRAEIPDLIKRAKQLKAIGAFEWPVVKPKPSGGMILVEVIGCDQNRMYFFEILFGSGPDRPHINTFSGRFVDHVGVIVDDRYSMEPMIAAMKVAGLEAQPITGVRNAFKEWAMKVKQNDLILHFEKRIPEWDGVPRVETRLIDLFDPFDTPLNRQFGRYFWLSLYNRITSPGCLAPIVLSLFGAQNAGKSRFSNEIVKAVIGNPDAAAVPLDLGQNTLDYLREITGNSVIGNIGEMTGYTRGDLNKIKDFITRTSDKMHYKFEGHFDQLRQWIPILDGNRYEGLQRDESGNRRFYPMFLGQLPDEEGKRAWKEGFEVDFTDFEDIFWQVMAECRVWMSDHGMKAYNNLVRETSKQVLAFSAEEMANDSGTIGHRATNTYFANALFAAKKRYIESRAPRNGGEKLPNRISVTQAAICEAMARVSRTGAVVDAIETKIKLMGGRRVAGGGEPVKYQWDYKPHSDPKVAAAFELKRRNELAAAESKKIAGDELKWIIELGYVDEFMTIHFGEDYENDLRLAGRDAF